MYRFTLKTLLLAIGLTSNAVASDCDALPWDTTGVYICSDSEASGWNFQADYLACWTTGAETPPLVSTSGSASLRSEAGVIGNPTTEVLYGHHSLNNGLRSGIRLAVERAFSDNLKFFCEGVYVGNDGDRFHSTSTGLPILARPYISAQTSTNDSELVAFPNVLEGGIAVDTTSQLYGFEIGTASLLAGTETNGLSLSTGYRFLAFEDRVHIQENLKSIDLGGVVPYGTTFEVQDEFNARNQFHGVNLRVDIATRFANWDVGIQPSLAFGGMQRRITIAGSTQTQIQGLNPSSVVGGLLAQPTNIGRDHSSVFTVVPEIRFKIGREIRQGLQFDVGYTFLLLPETVRAGEQIDGHVNQSQIGGGTPVGVAAPTLIRHEDEIWSQSLTFSLAWRR